MKQCFKLPFLIIVGLFLTILLTWPFVTKIKIYYPDVSDYALVGWILWYNQDSLVTGRILDQQAYFNSNQFYPLPLSLAYSEHLFIPSLIFAPIYWFSKDLIFSVNYYSILSFVLSFISSFYSIRFFMRKLIPVQKRKNDDLSIPFACLIGAFVFTFNPLTFAQFYGHHLQLMGKFFLPPLLVFAYLYITEPNRRNAFLFFLFFTLNALSSIYFQIFSLIFIPIFWLPFLLSRLIKKNFYFFIDFFKNSLIILIFLPFLFFFNSPYLQFSSLEGVHRTLAENAFFSARLADWGLSLKVNFLYGKLVQELDFFREPKDPNGLFNYSEHTLFPNSIPIFLFLFSFYFLRLRTVYVAFLMLLFASAYLTFGPFTNFYSRLYDFLIILQGIRVPTRFQFIFYLPFSLLVGLGAYKLLGIAKKFSILVLIIIWFFLILENVNKVNFNDSSQTLHYIDSQKNNKSILIKLLTGKKTVHFPIFTEGPANNTRYLNWSTVTREIIFNGYSGYYPDDWGNFAKQIKKLDQEALKKMDLLGFDYLVIHKDLFSQADARSYNNIDLLHQAQVYKDEKIEVVDLKSFKFKETICTTRDIKFEINVKSYPITQISGTIFQIFPKIILLNPKDCYLVSKYQDRYSKIEFIMKGKKQSLPINLPLLIEPQQKIKLN